MKSVLAEVALIFVTVLAVVAMDVALVFMLTPAHGAEPRHLPTVPGEPPVVEPTPPPAPVPMDWVTHSIITILGAVIAALPAVAAFIQAIKNGTNMSRMHKAMQDSGVIKPPEKLTEKGGAVGA